MRWSKLKKTAENLLADSLKGRIQYHITRYGPGYSYLMSRAWITLDKEEIVDFSTPKWLINYNRTADQIREINNTQNYQDEKQKEGYYAAYDHAQIIMDQQGIYSRFDFSDSLKEYLQLSIEDSMTSANTIIRAISMLDRRLGKRRLRQIRLSFNEHPLVREFYNLRCESEGIKITD